MADNGKLNLKLLNANGKFLGEKVDVLLRNLQLGGLKKASVTATKTFTVAGLSTVPQGQHRMEIDPPSYLINTRFVSIPASGEESLEIVFAVDPKKVKRVVFPTFNDLSDEAQRLLNASNKVFAQDGKSGAVLYDALDNLRRAGMLNIITKTQATPLSNGKTVLPYIHDLRELRQDRFFAIVSKELREETKHSVAAGLFHKADESLHKLPSSFESEGFTPAGSFKTEDRYGNLQLSFFMKGDECVADIDIDDASGLEHIFQVLQNLLPGVDTHPYAIRDILLVHQKLDPGYTFEF